MTNIAGAICKDARKADKKRGHVHGLDVEKVREMISAGCSYCGEQKLRMTLDRIDNARGHTFDNVTPACIRCNYLRRDIPYAAWLILVPAVIQARLEGAFGDWTGRTRHAAVVELAYTAG